MKSSNHSTKFLIPSLSIYGVMMVLFSLPGKNFRVYFGTMASMDASRMKNFLSGIQTNNDIGLFTLIFVLDILFFTLLGIFIAIKFRELKTKANPALQMKLSLLFLLGPLSILADGFETTILLVMMHKTGLISQGLVSVQTVFSFVAFGIDILAVLLIISLSLIIRRKRNGRICKQPFS